MMLSENSSFSCGPCGSETKLTEHSELYEFGYAIQQEVLLLPHREVAVTAVTQQAMPL